MLALPPGAECPEKPHPVADRRELVREKSQIHSKQRLLAHRRFEHHQSGSFRQASELKVAVL
jgi:hypothetical protein